MIRSLILSFFLINLSSAFLLVSLVVSILSIFLLLGKTSSQPKQLSVSSWVILDFREVIDVILLTQIDSLSLLMSLSLRVPLSSPLKSILMFRMSYMSLLSYHLQISLLHLRMLLLDHFKFILVVLVLQQGLLLIHLLCHRHLQLWFCNRLMITLLPFGNVLALLVTHILFIIF